MLNITNFFHIKDEILAGRDCGEKLKEEVSNALKEKSLDILMPLNFSRVKIIDFTCADEFICKLICRLKINEYGERYIILENMNREVEENISAALKISELIAIGIKNNEYVLYGKFTNEIKEVFAFAVKQQRITARNLIDFKFVEKINVASNRLNKLCELGLIRRVMDEIIVGGGRQYIYEPLV